MSPPSPANCETPARPSLGVDASLAPRLKSLEAQAQVTATEIALLRQLGDDLGSWRYRVDSASAQTANVLQALNRDLDVLKNKMDTLQEGAVSAAAASAGRGAVEDLVSQMTDCYRDLQGALGRLKDGEQDGTDGAADNNNTKDSVAERLMRVEHQLDAAYNLASEHTEELELLRANGVQASVEARTAMLDAASATETAEAANAQLQALQLSLEVVEASLEELDSTDAVEGLRSRVDDIDAGVEATAERLSDVAAGLAELRQAVEAAATAAATADARARCASEDAAALRREIRAAGAPVASAPPSPAPGAPSSDPRVKAAVHTLSQGYRSLHRAMSLMYDEQAEVAGHVAAVGAAAAQAEAEADAQEQEEIDNSQAVGTFNRLSLPKLAALRKASQGSVVSHPIALTPRADDDAVDSAVDSKNTQQADEVAELRALVAAQAADAARQTRRAEALEEEVKAMRSLLAKLAVVQQPQEAEQATITNSVELAVASSPVAAKSQTQHQTIEQVAVGPSMLTATNKSGIVMMVPSDVESVAVHLHCDEESGSVRVNVAEAAQEKQQHEASRDEMGSLVTSVVDEWTIRTVV